jgi:hypothetical protein
MRPRIFNREAFSRLFNWPDHWADFPLNTVRYLWSEEVVYSLSLCPITVLLGGTVFEELTFNILHVLFSRLMLRWQILWHIYQFGRILSRKVEEFTLFISSSP